MRYLIVGALLCLSACAPRVQIKEVEKLVTDPALVDQIDNLEQKLKMCEDKEFKSWSIPPVNPEGK